MTSPFFIVGYTIQYCIKFIIHFMKISPKLKKISSISLMVIGGLAIVLVLGLGVMYLMLYSGSSATNDYSTSSSGYGDSSSTELGLDEITISKVPDDSSSSTESKIQKGGSVYIEVEDLDESYNVVYDILQDYNGDLTGSYESGEGNERYISMTLRIESAYFEDIYAEVKDIEGEVTYASYYTDDVTMEYTDLESRLKNLNATEIQLVTLLKSAKTVTETLNVYEELTSIRSQIEVIKGQLKYMDSQVDYSYITVSLTLSDTGMNVADDSWKPWGVVKNAFSSLVSLCKSVVDMLIWVVVFSPLVGIVIGVVVLIKKKKRKK